VFPVEGHRQVVLLVGTYAQFWLEVRSFDDEIIIETSPGCRVHRVDDCQGQLMTVFQDASDFPDRARHVVDVLEGHESYRTIHAGVSQWQVNRIGSDDATGAVLMGRGGPAHGHRAVDSEHRVTALLQIAADAAFTAADIEREFTGLRDK
jgi:hypothetical protein